MKTDRQVYKILQACPQWFFDLTQIESPGPCSFRSVALKEVSVTADGVLEPQLAGKTWFVVEFQAQFDETVYIRLTLEMALLHRQHPNRKIEGVLIFLDASMDPKTQPWARVIRSFTLAEQLADLEQRQPEHPLIAVFAPLTIASDETLESSAALCYNRIIDSDLDDLTCQTLADAFVSWLEQRFRDKGKQEIEEMLIGALPDLSDTQSGKDLIAIGVQKGEAKGEAKGKRESLLLILRVRFGGVPEAFHDSVMAIESVEQLDELLQQALRIESIDEFNLE